MLRKASLSLTQELLNKLYRTLKCYVTLAYWNFMHTADQAYKPT